MNLRHLRYFVALAERLNFTETAKYLGIAQPPLSVQIRNLETEMGGSLFHRERRKIRLTPLGVLLLAEARKLLQQAESAEERIRDAAEGRIGEIRIAYTEGVFSEKITRRIRKFLRKHRGVRFTATRLNYEDIIKAPNSDFDAIITELIEPFPGAITLEKASAQIAVPPKHRLIERVEVTPSDLIGECLILAPFSNRSPADKAILQSIDKEGIKLKRMEGSACLLDRLWQVSIGAGLTLCQNLDRSVLDVIKVPVRTPSFDILIQCLPISTTRAVALAPFLEAIRE